VAEIVRVLHAFWGFLQREFRRANAAASLEILTPATVTRLEREIRNPENFDMAKSMWMGGRARGFDMTSPEGMDAWIQTYNAELAASLSGGTSTAGLPFPLPPRNL
jgi:hypothetical protein